MNIQLLEKAIEILERPLPKKVTFDMHTYLRKDTDKLGQDCGTTGCIAYLLTTDSTFTDLGYSCYSDGPELKGHYGMGKPALANLFDISDDTVRYIFYSTHGDSNHGWKGGRSSIEAAINRIKNVIAGTAPAPYEVDDYEV